MAPRWGGLRLEPYDPDARDADGDGIVQEGTAWERPGGTRLVTSIGDLVRGRTATTRPRDLRVVGNDGKDVAYTPTYGAGDSPAGAATALSEQGAGSLKERGLPSVRDITKPVPQVLQEPADTRTPAERVRERNVEIQKRLTAEGAKFGEFDIDIADPLYNMGTRTRGERAKIYRDAMQGSLAEIQEFLRSETLPDEGQNPRLDSLRTILKQISPELRDYLLSKTPEELIDTTSEEALKYQNALTNVRVRMTPDSLMGVLSSGRVITTHAEGGRTGSRTASGPGPRVRYETVVGLPRDLDVDLRPVSGYAIHPDVEAARRAATEQELGRPLRPGDHSSLEGSRLVDFGGAEAYGPVVLQMRPEVSERSAVAHGDTLTGTLETSLIGTDDPDNAFLSMITSSQGSAGSSLLKTLRLLEGARTNDQQNFNFGNPSKLVPDENSNIKVLSGRSYMEVLIPGGIEAEDIQEIRVPEEAMDEMVKQIIKSDVELQTKLTDMMKLENLVAIGVPRDDAEEWLQTNRSVDLDGAVLAGSGRSATAVVPLEFQAVARHYGAEKLLEQAQEKGIPLKFFREVQGQNVDLWDPEPFGASSLEELEQLRIDRVKTLVIREVEMNRRMNPKPKRDVAKPIEPGEFRQIDGVPAGGGADREAEQAERSRRIGVMLQDAKVLERRELESGNQSLHEAEWLNAFPRVTTVDGDVIEIPELVLRVGSRQDGVDESARTLSAVPAAADDRWTGPAAPSGEHDELMKQFVSARLADALSEQGADFRDFYPEAHVLTYSTSERRFHLQPTRMPEDKVFAALYDEFTEVGNPGDDGVSQGVYLANGDVLVSPDTDKYLELYNRTVVSEVVRDWAIDSSWGRALVAQEVAAEVFDLKDFRSTEKQDVPESQRAAIRGIVDQMHKTTQQDLADGPKEVPLYRGMTLTWDDDSPLANAVQDAVSQTFAGKLRSVEFDDGSDLLDGLTETELLQQIVDVQKLVDEVADAASGKSLDMLEKIKAGYYAGERDGSPAEVARDNEVVDKFFSWLYDEFTEVGNQVNDDEDIIEFDLDNIVLQPLSSFSFSAIQSEAFAKSDKKSNVFGINGAYTVPTDRLLSTTSSGLGASGEYEAVVLGGGTISGKQVLRGDKVIMFKLLLERLNDG